MLTINIIGKNCNVKVDGNLYTVVVDENFDLKKLQNWGIKYYYNLNQSKEYFDQFGEHQIAEKRAKFKATADIYKQRIKNLVIEAIELKKNEKTKADYTKKLEKKKLEQEKRDLFKKENEKFYIFKQLKDFTVKQGKVYLRGLDFELPQTFLDVITKEYNNNNLNLDEAIQPYINFMYQVAVNPNENVRNKIFDWVHSNGFKITQNGYIYAVRWVVKVDKISELTRFVQTEYVKKKLQKKSPKNYSVWKLEGNGIDSIGIQYQLLEDKRILENKIDLTNLILEGNLFELYNQKKEVRFTDNHTKTCDIRLGKVMEMNRKDCDSTSAQCSTGYHALSLNYALNNSFGDQLIGILVSSSDIVALPYDHYEKFRCCKYYVKNILDESVIQEMKLTDLIVDDMDYQELNVNELLDKLEGRKNLFKYEDKLQEIKDKLKSFKGVKPVEPEQLAVVNRLIKL